MEKDHGIEVIWKGQRRGDFEILEEGLEVSEWRKIRDLGVKRKYRSKGRKGKRKECPDNVEKENSRSICVKGAKKEKRKKRIDRR